MVDTAPPLEGDRWTVVADPFAFYELSLEQGFGDGMPLLPPTEERVAAMLAGTPLPPEHTIVAEMHPHGGPATVEKIAANAVMAGCQPHHLPYVIAAVEAINLPGYNLYGVGATTGSAFQQLIVNGPSRDRMGIDYSYSCMGGATGRGSRTIGRATALCLRNIGGQKAGSTTKSCFGQPARHGLCFGEWEEMSPWPSLAEQRGYSPDDDVVHAHAGMGTMAMVDNKTETAEDLAYLLAKSVSFPSSNKMLPSAFNVESGEIVIAVNPDWAARLGRGFPRIELLQEYFLEHAWQPLSLWPEDVRHEWECRTDDKGRVHMNGRPEQFIFVVCGGQVALHAVCLPSWGETEMQSRPVLHAG